MAVIIYLVVLLLGVKSYLKQRYVGSVVSYAFLVTNGFIINWGSLPVKGPDMGLFLLIICCFIGYKRNRDFFNVKKSVFGRQVAIFLLFFFVVFLYSLILQVDSLKNILAVLRVFFSLAVYFFIRTIPYHYLKRSCLIIGKIVVLVSILFVLQYITHIPLVNTYVAESTDNYRMQVIPPFLQVLILFLIFYGQRVKMRFLFLILLLSVLIISQNRTPIYGMILQVIIYFCLSRNIKQKFGIIAISVFALPFISTMIEERDDGRENFMSVSEVISHIERKDFLSISTSSTFMFRIALCAERADYLIQNPEKLLLGVGAMHENSNNNNFKFSVGTPYMDSKGNTYRGQLQTGDTTWGPIIIRYGLLGVCVTFGFLLIAFLKFYRKRELKMGMFGFIYMIGIIFTSISQYQTFTYEFLFLYALMFNLFERELSTKSSCKSAA